MNEDEKLNKIEEEDEDEFSLSEDIALSTRQHTSSESSKTGEKKKRKFKPVKFISKHLKIKRENKKSDSGDGESETRSEDGTKSPMLGILLKKNIAKRFSRKKKYQITPLDSGASSQHDEPLNNERDLKESENLTKSDPNMSLNNNNNNDQNDLKIENKKINEDPLEFLQSLQTIDMSNSPLATESTSSFQENKKVQLQITISGKKIEKLQTNMNETFATVVKNADKASAPLQYTNSKSQNDIILPSLSTGVRVDKIRNEFFNVMVSPNSNIIDNANTHMQHHTKSISSDAISQSVSRSTIIQTGSEGYARVSQSEKEIEKTSSSASSFVQSAEDLEKLSLDVNEKIEFPENFPELKIVEDIDIIEKRSESTQQQKSIKVEKEIVIEENNKKLNIETGKKELSSDEMKKSKIPVNRRKSSENTNEIDMSQPTVHTQEAHKPYHLNLSASLSADENENSSEPKSEEIIFEVGTAVRPPKILSANSNNSTITPIIVTGIESESLNAHESGDDVFHSPKSEPNVTAEKRDSKTRRKIAYIPQLTIYTPEEQELLKSNIIANHESFDTPSLPPDSSMFPVFDDSLVRIMTPSTPEKRECLYKILVIGELGTGKTSFIKRYVHQFFSQNYRATIGVDFALKVLNWDQSTIIRLQLWDIAGQERFGNMTRVYYKEAVGAFIVFDVTRPATFDAVNKWKTDLDSKVQLPDGSNIPCILLANKCDQPKQGMVTMPAKMDEYCKLNGFAGWFETSAKENTNIDESAKALVSKILINDKLIHNDMVDGERLILNEEDIDKPKKFCSC